MIFLSLQRARMSVNKRDNASVLFIHVKPFKFIT